MAEDKFNIYKQFLSNGATSDECLFCDGNDDDLLIIGGTREQTFNLPFDFDLLRKIVIVYVQDGVTLVKKVMNKNDHRVYEPLYESSESSESSESDDHGFPEPEIFVSNFDNSLLYYTLTEEETSRFSKGPIQVQMKCLLEDGSILISQIFHVRAVDTIDGTYFNNEDLNIYPIQVDVNKQNVELKQLSKMVSGTYDVYKCRFVFI